MFLLFAATISGVIGLGLLIWWAIHKTASDLVGGFTATALAIGSLLSYAVITAVVPVKVDVEYHTLAFLPQAVDVPSPSVTIPVHCRVTITRDAFGQPDARTELLYPNSCDGLTPEQKTAVNEVVAARPAQAVVNVRNYPLTYIVPRSHQ